MALTRVRGAADNVFDTVALAKAANLKVGDRVETLGYTSANDGGGAKYRVVAAATGTDDGGSYHDMSNGLQLELIGASVINVLQWGVTNDGIDSTTRFNAIVSYVNTNGTNGVNTGSGHKIYFPRGSYYFPTGLNAFTVDGVNIIGEGKDVTLIKCKDNTVFQFGDGNVFVDSCSVRRFSAIVDTAETPTADCILVGLRHGTRLTIDDIRLNRVPGLLYAYADPAETISNIRIQNVVGQQYDSGTPLIECFKDVVGYTSGAGAGLYLHSVRVNLDGVAAPLESDGTDAHTATANATFLRVRGFWDTIIGSDCISNRHYKGIHFTAPTTGYGITNTYFSNFVLDYTNENAIHLEATGGNITKLNFINGWLNTSEGDTVSITRTSGLVDMIAISYSDVLMAGLNNFDIGNGCSNIKLIGNRLFGCGRKQITSSSPVKTSHGFNVGSDCDGLVIKDNYYRDGFSYYGAGTYPVSSGDYDPSYGINLASVAMQFEISGNKMRGATGGYSFTAGNLLATGNTEQRQIRNNYNDDNTNADYLGFGGAGLAASPATETNRTGCRVVYNIRSGTVSQISVNGQVVGNASPAQISLDHGDSITITYSSAPVVVRQLLNS